MESSDPHGLLRLRHALQALAAPFAVQVDLFPTFVCVADELALDFSHWFEVVRRLGGVQLTPAQSQLLEHIDSKLEHMSGPQGPWSLDDLDTGSDWSDLRTMAKSALTELGWPIEPPPPSPDTFVPGG